MNPWSEEAAIAKGAILALIGTMPLIWQKAIQDSDRLNWFALEVERVTEGHVSKRSARLAVEVEDLKAFAPKVKKEAC